MRSLLARATRALASGLRVATDRPETGAAGRTHRDAITRACSCTVEALEGRRLLSTYYVSPSGSDSNAGTSSSRPWKTISKVNGRNFNAGDKILFKGGSTFTGELRIGSEDAGSSSAPVTFGSYGSGKATIKVGSGRGIALSNASNVKIEDLKVVGDNGGTTFGIKIGTNNGGTYSNVTIDNVEVSGFNEYGINVVAERNSGGFKNVKIQNSRVHNNLIAGIKVHNDEAGGTMYSHSGILIKGNRVYNNFGSTSKTVSGSGILVSNVNGATIERNVVYNNGAKGKGAIGLWGHDSSSLKIRYNETYGQRTNGTSDGGGIGLDRNTKNSVIEYNWSHDNDGHGIGLAQWKDNANFTNNTVRYNLIEDNGRRNGYSGIALWGQVLNTHIYNNTVHSKYLSKGGGGENKAFRIFKSGVEKLNGGNSGLYPDNIYVRNNIFIARGGAKLVEVNSDVTRSGVDIYFQNNAYWTYGSTFKITHGGSTYSSLTKWRSAKGQERFNGRNVGFQVDPKLKDAGDGWTVGDAYDLEEMTAYRLSSTSPLQNKGLATGPLAGATGLDLGAGVIS